MLSCAVCNCLYQGKKETVQLEDKSGKQAKKLKTKQIVAVDEATASEESSDIAIVQAATGCQVGEYNFKKLERL